MLLSGFSGALSVSAIQFLEYFLLSLFHFLHVAQLFLLLLTYFFLREALELLLNLFRNPLAEAKQGHECQNDN